MQLTLRSLKNTWAQEGKNKLFYWELIFSVVFLIATMVTFSHFLKFIERREGIQFNDPLLGLIPTYDLSHATSFLIYGAILFALIVLIHHPTKLVTLFEAYAVMVLIRIVMMSLLPLNPPSDMILLKDPFENLFADKILTKDLFFSGHTATMFLLFLSVPRKFKAGFFLITVLVAAGVLIQKVHYTIDVVVAPFASFMALYLVMRIKERQGREDLL